MTADLKPLLDRMRTDVCWVDARLVRAPVTPARLSRHLDGGPRVGCAFIRPGESTCQVAVLDLDSHKGETPWPDMCATALLIGERMEAAGLSPLYFRSSGGQGIHIYALWVEPQDAYSVRKSLAAILSAVGLSSGVRGVSEGEVEIFPKQDSVPEDGFGNMAILPFGGKSCQLEPLADLADVSRTVPVAWFTSKSVPVLARPSRELAQVEPSTELATFAKALDAIPNETEPLDYDQWRNVVFSIHHATGGSDEGLAMAHAFSGRSGKYDPDFLDNRVWPYINDREGGITDRYVMALAQEHGFVDVSPDDFDDLGPEPRDEATDTPSHDRFVFQQAAEFAKLRSARYTVKGVLPETGLGVVYGDSTSGKSFFMLDLVMAIVRGTPWRERRVHGGKVAYLCAEGAAGFGGRMRAYAKHNDIDLADLPLYMLDDVPNFLEVKDIKTFVPRVIGLGADLKVIVVDTAAQAMPGGNENSSEDMGLAIAHCRLLARLTGALVILIHHSGKDASRGARGWSGLRAACDVEIEVVAGDTHRSATITKMKDGESDVVFGFKLEDVILGVDEDGDPFQSAVVVDSGPCAPAKKKKERELTGNLKLLADAIRDLSIGTDGWVDLNEAKDVVVGKLPEPTGARDQRKGSLNVTAKSLEKKGIIELSEGFARLTSWKDQDAE